VSHIRGAGRWEFNDILDRRCVDFSAKLARDNLFRTRVRPIRSKRAKLFDPFAETKHARVRNAKRPRSARHAHVDPDMDIDRRGNGYFYGIPHLYRRLSSGLVNSNTKNGNPKTQKHDAELPFA
jgi:hypothetical protein